MTVLQDQIQAQKAEDIRLTFESAYKHLTDKPGTDGWNAVKDKQRSLGFPPDYSEVYRPLVTKIANTFRSKTVSDICVITAQKIMRNLYFTKSQYRIGENIDVKLLLIRIKTGGYNHATRDEISTHYAVMSWMYGEPKVRNHKAFQFGQDDPLTGGLHGLNLTRAAGLACEVVRILGPKAAASPGLLKEASLDEGFVPVSPVVNVRSLDESLKVANRNTHRTVVPNANIYRTDRGLFMGS